MADSSLESERMVVPLSGPYRDFYEKAFHIQDIEHPSSNLFLNLIKRDLPFIFIFSEVPPGSAENRRRLDHKFETWNSLYNVFHPVLLKESKAVRRGKKGVESQIGQGLEHDLEHHNLGHLYGISTIGTTFRAWTARPKAKLQPFDSDAGYCDISSPFGVMIWNDFMNAIKNDPPTIMGNEGLSSESDNAMDDAPLPDPQSIPAILNSDSGPSKAEQPDLWMQVEVHGAYKENDKIKFFHPDGKKSSSAVDRWTYSGQHWSLPVYSENINYYCEEIKGM